MSEETRKLAVEYSFTGFWFLVFLTGMLVSWRTSTGHNQAYRAFVPIFGAVILFCIVGSIYLGGAFYPHE